MLDARDDRGAMTVEHFGQLVHDLQYGSFDTPESVLTGICAGLITMKPICAAGLFRLDQASDRLHWLALDPFDDDLMHRSLAQEHVPLSRMLLGKSAQVQLESGNPSGFVGIPAGMYDGAPLGLGVTVDRPFDDDELARLSSFGMTAGLIAENARLTGLFSEADEAASTAHLLGFIAHELRTPLTGMRGNIQLALMASRKGQHDRVPNRLEAAINSVDGMSGLVQKLLDVSRLERGAFPLSLDSGPIGQTITRAVDSCLDEPKSCIDRIPITGDTETAIEHDHQALQEAFCFLLNRLNWYLDEKTVPEIAIADSDVFVRVQISYAGSVISDKDLAVLMAPLSNTRPSNDHNDQLSLDLAYCRGVIRRHDGQIFVHSDTPSPNQQSIEILLPRRALA
ncbi:MAG: sensor histidine kinase [Sphaerobacteraceae bacterium]|nr:MAG: sensor histidine kinase [Sphaerobacteraceae bacterium]